MNTSLVIAAPAHAPERGSTRARATRPGLGGRIAAWVRHADPGIQARRIPGLPEAIALADPAEPVLLLARDSAAMREVVTAIADACGEDRRIAWLASASSPGALRRRLPGGELARLVLPFLWTEEAVAEVQRLGAARVLRELQSCGMGRRDVLVIDALEPWLGLAGAGRPLAATLAEARAALLHWTRSHSGPVLVLGRARFGGQGLEGALAQAGFGRCFLASAGAHGLRLSAPGAAAAGFDLTLLEQGWSPAVDEDEDEDAPRVAGESLGIQSQAGALVGEESAPAGWQPHDTLEDLLAECERNGEGGAVLAYGTSADFPPLARGLFRLRRSDAFGMPVVVRETGARLRNGERRVLRMLGASGIVLREEGLGRVLDLLEAGRGDTRACSLDEAGLERLLLALEPGEERGYLPVPAFCQAALRQVRNAQDTPVGHVLAYLPLLEHVRHIDALLSCFVRRAGDLVTADARGVYVFLHGCDQRDAHATLEGLFELPISELFGMVELQWDEPSQRRDLEALQQSWQQHPDDFTTALQVLHAEVPATVAQVLSTAASGPAPAFYRPPPPPMARRVLPLRGGGAPQSD